MKYEIQEKKTRNSCIRLLNPNTWEGNMLIRWVVVRTTFVQQCFEIFFFFLEQKGTSSCKKMAIFPFNHLILLKNTNIRWFMNNSFFLKIRKQNLIKVIFSIVRFELFYSHTKLGFDHVMKVWKDISHIIFLLEKKNLRHMSTIINK